MGISWLWPFLVNFKSPECYGHLFFSASLSLSLENLKSVKEYIALKQQPRPRPTNVQEMLVAWSAWTRHGKSGHGKIQSCPSPATSAYAAVSVPCTCWMWFHAWLFSEAYLLWLINQRCPVRVNESSALIF